MSIRDKNDLMWIIEMDPDTKQYREVLEYENGMNTWNNYRRGY